MTPLTPGTYRLTRDVKNPKPSHRKFREWSFADVVPAGSVFSVSPHPVSREESVLELRCQGFTTYGDYALEGSALFAAVAPHLQIVAESPSDLLFREQWTLMGSGILDQLFRAGLITTEQVEAAARAHLAAEIQKACEAGEKKADHSV